jgi:hypothetical protein
MTPCFKNVEIQVPAQGTQVERQRDKRQEHLLDQFENNRIKR